MPVFKFFARQGNFINVDIFVNLFFRSNNLNLAFAINWTSMYCTILTRAGRGQHARQSEAFAIYDVTTANTANSDLDL